MLTTPPVLLDADEIKKYLGDLKTDITVFETIDSTNEYLKRMKQSDGISYCLAEQQTQGKGRLQREWHSPFGKNLYFSCRYPCKKNVGQLSGLSLVVSLAILATLKQTGVTENIFVKWPNDLVCENKKISGSLIDIEAQANIISHVIIGIGINVNMLQDDGQISQQWTSLQKILGHYVDRNLLCARLIVNLRQYLQAFEAHGFAYFMDEWMRSDLLMGQSIALKNVHHKSAGTVLGVNDHGHLLLQLPDGEVHAFSSGDSTILKKPE